MRRKTGPLSTIRSVFWLVILCLALWSSGLQPLPASAYQGDGETPTPSPESTTAVPPEEVQPTLTETLDAPLTASPAETETSLPATTASATGTPENITLPTSTSSLPLLPALPGDYVPDEVLVRFKRSAFEESIQDCLSLIGANSLSAVEELNVRVVHIPFGQVAGAIAAFSACPEVRYAEPNYLASVADTFPSDPGWGLQYGLVNIRAPQGWDYSTGSTAVTIAVIDSGVDLGHADLAAKIVPGYDFVNLDSVPQDDNGHGTHVAGIAAAIGNNGLGVAGVSWGARIMPVKVLNSGGNGSFVDVADGIIWAVDHGAQVINLSLGGPYSSAVLQDAVNYASGKGVVLVAAAGNTGSNTILYPARYPNVIAVGAVDSANIRLGISNFGPELDLMAPGSSIYSTVIGGYGYKTGTSMAAPYVSGLAAILRGFPAGYSSDAIAYKLKSSALDLGFPGFDNLYGNGLIQMDRAIEVVSAPPTSTPTFTPTSTPTFTPTSTPTRTTRPPGDYFVPLMNGPFSTATPVPIASPTPSPASPSPSSAMSDSGLDIYALAPNTANLGWRSAARVPGSDAPVAPPTRGKTPLSTFVPPCLGVLMILSGLGLWAAAGRRPDHRKMRYRI